MDEMVLDSLRLCVFAGECITSRKAAKTQSINQPQYLKEKKYYYGFKAHVPILYGSDPSMPDVPALLQASELERFRFGGTQAQAGGR
jgi:hypothetical protein